MESNYTDNRLFFDNFSDFNEWGSVMRDGQNDISLLFLNIRSMGKHWDTLTTQIFSAELMFDIIALAEVSCGEDEINLYGLPNYEKVFQLRQGKKGGGLVMFYNTNKLQFNQTNVENITAYEHITGVFETINCYPFKFTIHLIYRPPTSSSGISIPQAIHEIDMSLHYLKQNNNMVFLGDLNINLRSNEDLNVQRYETVLAARGLERGIWDNTREEIRLNELTVSCIDHLYYGLERPIDKIFTGVIKTKISDHYPICSRLKFMCGDTKCTNDENITILNNRRLENMLIAEEWRLGPQDNVNEGFLKITKTFNTLYDRCSKEVNKRKNRCYWNKGSGVKRKPWMTVDILNYIRERDRIFRLWKNDPTNDRHRELYKTLRNRIINMIRHRKNSYYRVFFEQNKQDSRKIWGSINGLLGRGKKNNIDDTITTAMNKIKSKSEILNGFADYFVEGVEEIKHICPRAIIDKNRPMEKYWTSRDESNEPNHRFYIPKVTSLKIVKLIEEMDENKSAGYDRIRVRDLKLVKTEISGPLAKLFNLSLDQGIFPDCLKKAVIRPIYKNKSKKEFQNYRPIAILPVIEKVLEKYVAFYLNKYLSENNILSERQFGFRKKKGTEDAFFEFVNKANEILDSRCHGLALFIDLSKAFDTIDHNELIISLYNIGIRGPLLKWFHTYLENRYFVVKLNNEYSREKLLTCGVPQGSRLGPTLFIIYLNEILKKIEDCDMWAFADDILMFSGHKDLKIAELKLGRAFTKFSRWTHDKGLVVNSQKTCIMHIKPKNMKFENIITIKHHKCECLLSLNQYNCTCESIAIVEKTKYLGVTVDNKLLWKEHIGQLQKRLSSCVSMMYNLRNKVSDKIKITVYKALFESIVRYGVSSWGSAADTHLKVLANMQRRCLKALDLNDVQVLHRDELILGQTSVMGQLTPKGWYMFSILKKYYGQNEFKRRRFGRGNMRYLIRYEVPIPNTTYGCRLPQYIVPHLCNSIPLEVDNANNLTLFKTTLYRWLNRPV